MRPSPDAPPPEAGLVFTKERNAAQALAGGSVGWTMVHTPQGRGSILVRAHAWIAGSIPGRVWTGGNRMMFSSLSFSFSSSLSKINKYILG